MSVYTTVTTDLVVVVCWCGCKHAIPAEMRQYQLSEQDKGRKHWLYCPHGHEYAPSGDGWKAQILAQNERLKRDAERERNAATRARQEATRQRRYAIAQKAAKTRLKNRIKNGVCPCCNRTFANLARHIANQHPNYHTNDA